MEKKYRIQIDGREMELKTEKEFKQFKKDYNEYKIMINEQFNVGIGTRKPGGGNDTFVEPEITLRDVVLMVRELAGVVKQQGEMINNLTLEVREGFRKVNERLDAHDLRFERIEEKLERHDLEFAKIHSILERNNIR